MFVAVSCVVFLTLLVLLYSYSGGQSQHSPQNDLDDLRHLQEDVQHDVLSAFLKLVDDDGAGHWPPKANHDEWPLPLRPYKDIYLMMAPSLVTADPSRDDELNRKRRQEFRSRMEALLTDCIDIEAAESSLAAVAAGDWDSFSREAYNGFYSCIACLRHAYRWATNPVVKVAQDEKRIRFPTELDVAWSYCKRRFDITSPSGNIMANAVCNFDAQGQLVYTVNEGMADIIVNTELAWCRIFYDSEVMSTPIYRAIIRAIICFEAGDKVLALAHSKTALEYLRKVMQYLYEHMNEPHVARSVWVRHVSGIHSWGAADASYDNEIEYGGLSGSQILLFLAVDAFLGLYHYHPEDEMKMHISGNMRDVCAVITAHSFRKKLSEKSPHDTALGEVFDQMVKQLRTFRSVHKTRAVRYLSAPAPERVPMTAALSVLDGPTDKTQEENPYKAIESILIKRLNETI